MAFFGNKYQHWSDEQLMEQVTQGNDRAFQIIYQRYSYKMLRFFLRMLNNEEELAQDFLQDLFIKVIDKAHSFDATRKFSTWLYTIAANMCKNEYRRREKKRQLFRPLEDYHQISEPVINYSHDDDNNYFLGCLERAMEELSPTHRQVFILRYQEELSVKKVSEIMGCSEGTVKSRSFHALRKLAQKLQIFNPKAN